MMTGTSAVVAATIVSVGYKHQMLRFVSQAVKGHRAF